MSDIKVSETSLTGIISSESNLSGKLSVIPSLSGTISSGSNNGSIYDGEYEVTPDVTEAQMLPTAKKYLTNDIVVNKVPYSETSNSSNGLTVYIGKEA